MISGVVSVLVYGKKKKKKTRLSYPKMLASPWEMVGGFAFGRTFSAGR